LLHACSNILEYKERGAIWNLRGVFQEVRKVDFRGTAPKRAFDS
jgi:hypothetical protein